MPAPGGVIPNWTTDRAPRPSTPAAPSLTRSIPAWISPAKSNPRPRSASATPFSYTTVRRLVAFAVCHLGKGSEAGSGTAYIKFGAARPGLRAATHFERLLSACEALAQAHGMQQLVAGVNTSRHDAYRLMLDRGFRAMLQGVSMQLANAPGYNRADCFVIDDWR